MKKLATLCFIMVFQLHLTGCKTTEISTVYSPKNFFVLTEEYKNTKKLGIAGGNANEAYPAGIYTESFQDGKGIYYRNESGTIISQKKGEPLGPKEGGIYISNDRKSLYSYWTMDRSTKRKIESYNMVNGGLAGALIGDSIGGTPDVGEPLKMFPIPSDILRFIAWN